MLAQKFVMAEDKREDGQDGDHVPQHQQNGEPEPHEQDPLMVSTMLEEGD